MRRLDPPRGVLNHKEYLRQKDLGRLEEVKVQEPNSLQKPLRGRLPFRNAIRRHNHLKFFHDPSRLQDCGYLALKGAGDDRRVELASQILDKFLHARADKGSITNQLQKGCVLLPYERVRSEEHTSELQSHFHLL